MQGNLCLVDYFFVVAMLLVNKSHTAGEPDKCSLLNGATSVRNMHLWDERHN